mgnify:CR=1 FL=1
MINLPKNISDSSLYIENPFIIFEIEKFLNDKDYDDLVTELKNRQDYDRKDKFGSKKKRSIGGHNIGTLKPGVFKNFCGEVLSKQFFNWFKSTHLPYFNRANFEIYVKNSKNPIFRIILKITKLFKMPIHFFHTEIEYSCIEKGAYIPPHTDIKQKRLSFVLYLLDYEIDKDMAENWGTVFYGPRKSTERWENFDCTLLDPEEANKFHKKYRVFHTTKFKKNLCACFIKSKESWHGVKENIYDKGRNAIVINVYQL